MVLETLIVALIGTASVTIALMFLPAAIELLHPKDSGPRVIQDGLPVVTIMPLTNIEEKQLPINPAIEKVTTPFSIITNLEI